MKSLEELSDSLNPLLVKEVRQLFHSKQYLVLMALFLLGELGVLYVIMLNYNKMDTGDMAHLGQITFTFQCVGMSLAVLIVCMFRTCQMFNKERMDKNLDYTRLCSITPFSVASGKLCSSVVLMLVIISLIAPFMVISYFLRGISLQIIFIWLAILVPIYLLGIQISILVGSIGKKGAEGFLVLAMVFVLPWVMGILAGITIARHGATPRLESAAVVLATVSFGLFLQSFAWTVALISRSKSNIMFWPRLCALVICLVYPILFFMLGNYGARGAIWRPGSALVMVCTIMALVVGTIQLASVFEREQPGGRVMAERPKSRFFRAVMFFLSSGRAGGICMSMLLMVLEGIVLLAGGVIFSWHTDYIGPLCVSIYAMFYCLFAIMLNRLFPKINTIVSFIITVALWLVAPAMIIGSYAALTDMSEDAVWNLLFMTPMFVLSDGELLYTGMDIRIILPLIPTFFLLLALAKYIILEFKSFVFDEEAER